MNLNNLNVCVLSGGDSAEREVSLASAKAVHQGLTQLGHNVTTLDTSGISMDELSLKQPVADSDVVFIALHGGAGENGDIQQALEQAGKPFTGSSSTSSATAMDKPKTKTIARDLGLTTPDWFDFPVTITAEALTQELLKNLHLPTILKPADGGSTVGLTLVREQSQIAPALELLKEHCCTGMAEAYITGRELTVAVFDGQPYEVVEIRPKGELYDYQAKYTKGGSEYFCPAVIDSSLRDKLRNQATTIFNTLSCSGLTRVDYILDSTGEDQFLEINTIPGMTDLSLAPMSAAGVGISFADLLQQSIIRAMNA